MDKSTKCLIKYFSPREFIRSGCFLTGILNVLIVSFEIIFSQLPLLIITNKSAANRASLLEHIVRKPLLYVFKSRGYKNVPHH